MLDLPRGPGSYIIMRFPIPEDMLCRGAHWTPQEANNQMKAFAETWSDLASWEARAKTIREGILSGLAWDHMPQVGNRFNPIIHSRREMDGYIVENIAIESFPGFYVTGNLYLPMDSAEKYPAILNPHGHEPNKRLTPALQYRGACFARAGAIAFVYDMLGHADSKQVSHYIPISPLLHTWNSKRVLDYLLSRPDVDPERIGITGGSGGGTQTFMLTALDERIKAAAPVVQVSAHFFGGCACESGMPIHKSAHHQTNNVEIAALAAPRPMMVVSDGVDWTRFTPNIEFPYLQRVYAVYGAEQNVENAHFPTEGHDYGYSKRCAAYNFFSHHLKLKYGNLPYKDGYDESFVTLLSPQELQVFTDEHPRPADALQGDEAVMDALGFAVA